jgi:hypothetical protein
MTSLGVSRLVVAKIVNHVESRITAAYNRHGYDVEKRTGLGALCKLIAEGVASGISPER